MTILGNQMSQMADDQMQRLINNYHLQTTVKRAPILRYEPPLFTGSIAWWL